MGIFADHFILLFFNDQQKFSQNFMFMFLIFLKKIFDHFFWKEILIVFRISLKKHWIMCRTTPMNWSFSTRCFISLRMNAQALLIAKLVNFCFDWFFKIDINWNLIKRQNESQIKIELILNELFLLL